MSVYKFGYIAIPLYFILQALYVSCITRPGFCRARRWERAGEFKHSKYSSCVTSMLYSGQIPKSS